jgi:PleD family two-component response regulator
MTRKMLEEQGFVVAEAADGREALAVFQHCQADLVLLDAKMPRLDGFGACRKMRRLSRGSDVPIIMVTSLADSDSVKSAMAAGATDYLTKPINWAGLIQLIKYQLEQIPAAAAD